MSPKAHVTVRSLINQQILWNGWRDRGTAVDAVSSLERQRTIERRKWFAALALSSFATHFLFFFRYPSGDVVWYFMPWYEHIVAHARIAVFANPFGNYTPPYLYLLSAASLLDGIVPTFYLIKLLACVGAAWLIFATYRLLRALQVNPRMAFAVAFIPSVTANASLLGQADTYWVAPCVLALGAAVRSRWTWVAFWSGLAFAFKAQAVFFAPFVLHLFITRRVPWITWLVAPAVYVAAMLPAWFAGWPAWDLATVYFRQALWQPDHGGYFISNGASWWTVYGWLDPSLALRTFWIGFVLAGAALLAGLILVPALSRRKLIALSVLSAAVFPFLLPGMHERFYLLADVLAFIYALAYPSRRSIAAAIFMQLASAIPVYTWAFEAEPTQLVAPPFAAIAIYLFLRELAGPADLSSFRQHRRILHT